jgi:hypothetical protein
MRRIIINRLIYSIAQVPRIGQGAGSAEPSNRLIRPSFCRVEMVYGTKESLMRLSGRIGEDA